MTTHAIILAGQRPGSDALCDAAGVAYKADIPVNGIPMLERVRQSIAKAGIAEPFILVGYPGEKPGYKQVDGAAGPADSALLAVQNFPTFITCCDHALLTEEMIRHFVSKAEASSADFCVGVVEESLVQGAYPETDRTYYRFSDHVVSGCDLFYVKTERGLNILKFWQARQHLRRNPMKIAKTIGIRISLAYLLGRLKFSSAIAHVSKLTDTRVDPIFMPFPEVAIDVDRPHDKVLVEKILTQKEPV